ncbi:MAG: hypothetical protein J6C46_00750 [Clostridia bacterium]|nr:hypothetical protein [Clostridia bacterium]
MSSQPKTSKTCNRTLKSVQPAKDTDGTDISVYTYEVEKNGKISTQTVKARKTKKYENKYNAEEHLKLVTDELIKYFNSYKFESANQLEEFRVLTKNNEKLRLIVDHIFTKLQVKITQLQLRQLIATEIINKMSVKISFN